MKKFLAFALVCVLALSLVSCGGDTVDFENREVSGEDNWQDSWTLQYEEAYLESDGLVRIKDNGKYCYATPDGNIVLTTQYKWAGDFCEGVAVIETENGLGFIDKTGRVIVNPQFYKTTPFKDGVSVAYAKSGDYDHDYIYVINTKGQTVYQKTAKSNIDSIEFHEGLAMIDDGEKYNEKYGFINTEGKVVIPTIYKICDPFSNGLARVHDGEKYCYIDKSGKMVIDADTYPSTESFSDGLACVYSNSTHHYIDTTGKVVLSIPNLYGAGPFKNGYIRIMAAQDKHGYVERDGSEKIPPKYTDAQDFSEELAAVEMNGKWGYIDKNGAQVIAPIYDRVRDFSEGLAAVYIDDDEFEYWEYIDKNGEKVTSEYFDFAESFEDGFARVVDSSGSDGWMYINKNGQMVWK